MTKEKSRNFDNFWFRNLWLFWLPRCDTVGTCVWARFSFLSRDDVFDVGYVYQKSFLFKDHLVTVSDSFARERLCIGWKISQDSVFSCECKCGGRTERRLAFQQMMSSIRIWYTRASFASLTVRLTTAGCVEGEKIVPIRNFLKPGKFWETLKLTVFNDAEKMQNFFNF